MNRLRNTIEFLNLPLSPLRRRRRYELQREAPFLQGVGELRYPLLRSPLLRSWSFMSRLRSTMGFSQSFSLLFGGRRRWSWQKEAPFLQNVDKLRYHLLRSPLLRSYQVGFGVLGVSQSFSLLFGGRRRCSWQKEAPFLQNVDKLRYPLL